MGDLSTSFVWRKEKYRRLSAPKMASPIVPMPVSISCIVPVYNGARFLAEALESILAQTLPPTEIIVVDDGSTDATREVARAYTRHVFYVRQPNAGPASARNCGIGLATGEF